MSPIAKKLLIKPGTHWLLLNAPEDYLAYLEPLPEGVKISFKNAGNADGVQLFVTTKKELDDALKVLLPALGPETIIWVTYPKKNKGIQTDLEMMGNWDVATKHGLRPVTSAAINDTWTALRFKPEDQVKTSDSRNSEIKGSNTYADFIDVDKKLVTLPQDAMATLQQAPEASAYFNSLAYTNKKEYVVWILSAKQDKTRVIRVTKMVEMLLKGKKNPSDK